ncbi:MAG: EF-hand domain-containing protein [Verrucomicrobiales bacterium]|nr:EF-hand domain-containing protein [Verrucomicrobiales bacterium]
MNFNEGLIDAGTWVLRTSIEASVLLLLIGLLLALGKRVISPQLRVVLWSVVGIRFLLPVAPESGLSLFGALPPIPVSSHAAMPLKQDLNDVKRNPERIVARALIEESASPSSPQDTIALGSAMIWLTGMVGIISIGLLRQRRAHRQIRQWPAVSDPAFLALIREAGIHPLIKVVEHTSGGGIGVFGFFQATHLILPADMLKRYTAGQTLGILRHEAEHIRRSDLAWNWILFLIQSLHWFNPLVWLAGRQLRNEREILCDDAALSRESFEVRRDYGSALIRALESNRLPAAQAALLPFISRKNEMKQRLHQIMKNPTYSLLPQIGVALLALTGVIITFTSSVSPANAADEKADKPAAEKGKNANPDRDGDKPKEGARDGDKPKEGARDGDKPKEGARDGDKPKAGEGDKEKAKQGDKPVAGGAKMNSDERDIFNAYDKDGDSMISDKDMESMLEGKQNSSGRRQIRKEIDRSDKDKDGKLNEEEFLFWYKKGRLDEKAKNE